MPATSRIPVPVLVGALALLLAIGLVPLTAPPATAAEGIVRSAGPDRIATAVAASRDHRQGAEHALLATAGTYPDALAAGALAAGLDAPLLLTSTASLPPAVGEELARLDVRTVWILGGSAVVSPAVEDDLVGRGYEVRRLAGEGRYDTAREIALTAGPSATGEVVVALGHHPEPERAWPDAVASGALAASPDRVPTLLTAHDQLPAATERGLAELGARRVLLIGGTAAIGPAVEQRIRDLGYPVERIAGSTRYETSIALAADALGRAHAPQATVVFATGADFPDALAAGALAGSLTSPLVLVPAEDLARSVEGFLRDNAARWDGGVVVGGGAAASDLVLEQLGAAVAGRAAPRRTTTQAASRSERGGEQVLSAFEGRASWYGPGFHGRRTANGESFDRNALTAAHRTLPFGTRVRVTHLANGAQVTVRINDRGPFTGGRVIDLSERAAGEIGMIASGTGQVRVEVLAN